MRAAALLCALVALCPGAGLAQARPVSPRAQRAIETAEAFLASGDRGSAVGYFRDALAADSFATRAYEGLAAVYVRRGALHEARAVYEAGLARVSDHAPLWLGLARTWLALGSQDEASRALREYLRLAPRDVEGLAMWADLARERGAWSEALTACRALLALPLSPERATETRRYEAALRLLARPLDPVSAPRACRGSAVRRALAGCP